MKVYIAGYYDTRDRLFRYAHEILEMGHEITAEWLKEPAINTYQNVDELYRLACAIQDTADVRRSDVFIADTLDVSERGGREFEMGVAFSSGIPIYIVGPMRNVFHRLFKQFNDWDSFLTFFRQVRR